MSYSHISPPNKINVNSNHESVVNIEKLNEGMCASSALLNTLAVDEGA